MSEYSVYFTQTVGVTVSVEADDIEDAIERAYDEAPGSICAQCSGWGRSWDRDEDGELKLIAVSDESGNEVWSEDSNV